MYPMNLGRFSTIFLNAARLFFALRMPPFLPDTAYYQSWGGFRPAAKDPSRHARGGRPNPYFLVRFRDGALATSSLVVPPTGRRWRPGGDFGAIFPLRNTLAMGVLR